MLRCHTRRPSELRKGAAGDGAAFEVARRYLEIGRDGPQRLCVLAAEVGGNWNEYTLLSGLQAEDWGAD